MARSVLESAPSTPSEDHSQSSTLAVDPGWILPPMTCALQASTRGRAGTHTARRVKHPARHRTAA